MQSCVRCLPLYVESMDMIAVNCKWTLTVVMASGVAIGDKT